MAQGYRSMSTKEQQGVDGLSSLSAMPMAIELAVHQSALPHAAQQKHFF